MTKPVGNIYPSNIPVNDGVHAISPKEAKQVLVDFNDTKTGYPKEKTIHGLFEEQAARTPEHIAVVGPAPGAAPGTGCIPNLQYISYGELNKISGQLAGYLHWQKKIRLNEPVGIIMDKSMECIIAVLAILKAGGAYLFINPSFPHRRIKKMINDSAIGVVITQRKYIKMLDGMQSICPFFHTCLCMDGNTVDIHHQTRENFTRVPDVGVKPGNLAYIIYTSGSMGNPKGVMVTHQNVVRLVKNTNYITLQKGDRILQTGALEFDASTFEIWTALLNGLPLVLVYREILLTPDRLKQVIQQYGISIMWMTSGLFNQMLQLDIMIFAGLKTLLVGGDILSVPNINRLREQFPRLNVINGYGPTENTTFSTTYLIGRKFNTHIPIGKPIANSTAYILDKKKRLLPVGGVGELVVGGDGVATGYLNSPELTAERFLSGSQFFYKSYRSYRSYISKRFYKTGDLAYWLEDGNIKFLGRIDNQVKIRGFRIEPGEIENQLMKHEQIKEVIIKVHGSTSTNKFLCAYVVSTGSFTLSALKEYLSGNLPDYMIPSALVLMEKLPLTANGKVDRKALPEPVRNKHAHYAPPTNEIEKELINIWTGILNPKPGMLIGIDDNFFELGGHSIAAAALNVIIQKTFNVKISLVAIFETPVIRQLAKKIRGQNKIRYLPLEPVEKREYYPVPVLHRRIFLDKVFENTTRYNVFTAFQVQGALDIKKCIRAFQALSQRYDIFRTTFHLLNGEVVQRITDKTDVTLHQETCGKEKALERIKTKAFVKPFDLSTLPLLRLEVLQVDPHFCYLLVDSHHIITDAISNHIWFQEFLALYRGKHLEPLSVQFKDYAVWRHRLFTGKTLEKYEKYWLKQLDNFKFSQLPPDYPDHSQRKEYQKEFLNLGPAVYKKIAYFCHHHGITKFSLLTGIFQVILAREINRRDITIGARVAKRDRQELKEMIGCFIDKILIRSIIDKNDTFLNTLQKINQTIVGAMEHSYPYEILDLKIRRHQKHRPLPAGELFAIRVNYFPPLEKEINISNAPIKIKPVELHKDSSKYPVGLNIEEKGENLHLMLIYNHSMFSRQRMIRILKGFTDIIHRGIEKPDLEVCSLYSCGREGTQKVPEVPSAKL